MNAWQYTEDQLVEKPAMELLAGMGWRTANAYDEHLGPDGTLGRETQSEIVLLRELRPALERLNPGLPSEAIQQAIDGLSKDRSAMDTVRANREVYDLMRDGVKIKVHADDGSVSDETVRVIDWNDPGNNDYLLVSQLWVVGDMYKRRADLVGFVNGLPLVFIELKASHKRIEDAYEKNLTDYRRHHPPRLLGQRLHHPVERVAVEDRHGVFGLGALLGVEEARQREASRTSSRLEMMLRGTCEPSRLLDLVENFTAYLERPRGPREARRQEPPVPRRQQRHRTTG